MRTATLLFVLLCLPLIVMAQKSISDPRTGISISFESGTSIFPSSWQGGKINAKAEALDKKEYERSKQLVLKILAKYPAEVIKNNLNTVYVCNRLTFYGQPYGGTSSSKTVYLVNRGTAKGFSNAYIERVFHAEFSSILLKKYKHYFNQEKWKACNDASITYGMKGVDALKTGKSNETFDKGLIEKGVLNEYACSNLENDFNSFAKNLFLPKYGFKKVLNNNYRIRKKRQLFIQFYSKINPAFTESYFDAFMD